MALKLYFTVISRGNGKRGKIQNQSFVLSFPPFQWQLLSQSSQIRSMTRNWAMLDLGSNLDSCSATHQMEDPRGTLWNKGLSRLIANISTTSEFYSPFNKKIKHPKHHFPLYNRWEHMNFTVAGTTGIWRRNTFLHIISNSSCGKGPHGRQKHQWMGCDSLHYLSTFTSLDKLLHVCLN